MLIKIIVGSILFIAFFVFLMNVIAKSDNDGPDIG